MDLKSFPPIIRFLSPFSLIVFVQTFIKNLYLLDRSIYFTDIITDFKIYAEINLYEAFSELHLYFISKSLLIKSEDKLLSPYHG